MEIAAAINLAGLATPSLDKVGPTMAPDDLTAQRFREAMAAPPVAEPVAPDIVAPADQAAPPPMIIKSATLGDAILGGIQNLSSEFQQSWRTVHAALESGNQMTMTEMLKLQMGLVQVSVQYEMMGKAISRSTQNIDQLVKMQ